MADRIASFKIFEKGNGFRYPFLLALILLFTLYSCKGIKSSKEPPHDANASRVQKDDDYSPNQIVINIDSIGQISIDGNYAHIDSLGSVLQRTRDFKMLGSSDSTEILWVIRVHPLTKMRAVVDVKKELTKLGDSNLKYEKSP